MRNKVIFSEEEFSLQCKEAGVSLKKTDDLSVFSGKLTVLDKQINNRLACQAMEGCDGKNTGEPDELTERRYLRLASGGAGLIWFEATAVMPEGRANPRQLWITKDNVGAFASTVEKIKEKCIKENGYEPVVIMQATHSGRYSKPEGTPAPLIAYNNPVFEKDKPISSDRIVTDEYLDIVRDKLVEGAVLAQAAGFDGADIKCCHRYLNSELLSAYGRTGRYGGSFENRTRLLRESVKGALESCSGNFIVTSRLNVYDGFEYPYGFGVKEGCGTVPCYDEAKELLKILYGYGVRLVNITMGNPYFNPHVNRPYAQGGYIPPEPAISGVARMMNGTAEIKKAVPGMKILCSGLSYLGTYSQNVAAAYIGDGDFDLAGFGRTILAYPDFAKDILSGGMKKEKCCLACSKCTEIMRTPGGTPGCAVRDKLYTDIYRSLFK